MYSKEEKSEDFCLDFGQKFSLEGRTDSNQGLLLGETLMRCSDDDTLTQRSCKEQGVSRK